MDKRDQFLDAIRSNINQHGFHLTIVKSKIEPRYAYTIGLASKFKFELVFAGGAIFLKEDLFKIFGGIIEDINNNNKEISSQKISVSSLGTFSFSVVDPSWSKLMMLGVFDYYNTSDIKVFQIIPDSNHYTLDIPVMSNVWNASSEPVWEWLVNEWKYSIAADSTVLTNIDALKGETVTEVLRSETNEWEMFAGAGPDVKDEDVRIVSLGTIIGIDKSLLKAISLDVGKGLWRESVDLGWNDWG